MSLIFMVVLRTRKRLSPKDVAAVKELIVFTTELNNHTYHSRFIPEGLAEITDIPPRCPRFTKTTTLQKMTNTADVSGGPIAV
jgi:hypothetical protein